MELIDFVTDDPEELADAQRRYDEVLERARTGELTGIE